MVDRNESEPPQKKRKLSVTNEGDDVQNIGNITTSIADDATSKNSNTNIHKSFTNANKLSHLGSCNLLGVDQEMFDIVNIRNEINELCNTDDGQFILLSLDHNHLKQRALGCNNIYKKK